MAAALILAACGGSGEEPPPDPGPPDRVMPAGRLVQATANAPITHVTEQGWRTRIEAGTVTIQPPAATSEPGLQYIARRMRDQLGTHDLRAWSSDRRTVLLPGGAKITLHGQAGEIIRLSLYDGNESHEVDVLTQTLMHSRVDPAVAQAREAAEADGETANLAGFRGAQFAPQAQASRLHLLNLYVQPAGVDGTPQRRTAAVQVLGRQSGVDLETNTPPPAPAAEADQACVADGQPHGGLATDGTGLIYHTRSGAWTVRMDQHTITVTRSGKFTWQSWGDPHENLNGKHIKDWNGGRRTLLLDDGTRITMHADGPHHVVHTTSIHDGARSHEIGNIGNVIRHSCVNAQVTATREAQEADGETAILANLKGPAAVQGYLHVDNVYNEADGATGVAEADYEVVTLGETGDADTNPTQVNDYYDDPRLGHT